MKCVPNILGECWQPLAANGKDDDVVHYVDTIKAMSARQLELHYVIYKAWQALLNQKIDKPINVALSVDVQRWKIFMAGGELAARLLPYDRDLTVLHRLGLIQDFKYDTHIVADKSFPMPALHQRHLG